MTFLLAIDLGTSSVKVALVAAETLRVVAEDTREYPVLHPKPAYAEQDPQAWWEAVSAAVQQVVGDVDPAEVVAVGLSGQMHGLVCLDADRQPLGTAVIWADARSTEQVAELAALQVSTAEHLPGLPATGFAASSFRWMRQHTPERLANMAVWCLPKDYIRLHMTGELATEPSDAASTWLYDVLENTWAAEVCAYCGLQLEQMPPIQPSGAVIGGLLPEVAAALGLQAGTPVVGGSADLPAQGLGHGIVNPDTLLVTVGTGGQLFIPTEAPTLDPDHRYYLFNHNQPGRWYKQAAMLAGGISLRWFRDVLDLTNHPKPYVYLSELAESVSAGADGLLFLPYLMGERSPHMDSTASGVFFGLRLSHTRAHLARAIMEGVAFGVRDCFEAIAAAPSEIVLSGGITQSPVWRQILADVLEHPLQLATENVPHGCIGAAILAGVGAGIYRDADDAIQRLPAHTQSVQPNPQPICRARFDQYRRLYPLLRDEMRLLQTPIDF